MAPRHPGRLNFTVSPPHAGAVVAVQFDDYAFTARLVMAHVSSDIGVMSRLVHGMVPGAGHDAAPVGTTRRRSMYSARSRSLTRYGELGALPVRIAGSSPVRARRTNSSLPM